MKTVVYTCADLDYDQIFSPVVATPGVECLLFSARRPRLARGWRWRPLPAPVRGLAPTLANRFCKFFPHRILPGIPSGMVAGIPSGMVADGMPGNMPISEAECSIYVDANTLILSDLTPLIAEFQASGAEIGLFRHRERSSLREEFEFGLAVGKIPAADRDKGLAQLRRYQDEGLPADAPFTENAIIFRRRGGPALEAAMELWWDQLETYTRRDQLSLPYVLYKSGIAVKLWDWNYKYPNPYFLRYPHRRGPLGDLNVFLKNQRHYGPLRRHLCGALLFLSHGGKPHRAQHRREAPRER